MPRGPRKPNFHHFSELTHANVNSDFQVHTNWTDGEGTVAEVLNQAREIGLAEIAFTEHARASSSYYVDFFREIDTHDARTPEVTVYRGFEVKALDSAGTLDISPEMRAVADIVLGSVHSFPAGNGGVAKATDFAPEDAQDIEFGLAKGIVESGDADVLSHAGGMCLRGFGRFPMELMDRLVATAARRGIAFEINVSYHAAILDLLLPLLARHDPLVSVGSDAHRLDQIGACRDALRESLSL